MVSLTPVVRILRIPDAMTPRVLLRHITIQALGILPWIRVIAVLTRRVVLILRSDVWLRVQNAVKFATGSHLTGG